jgi:hypothetical protein
MRRSLLKPLLALVASSLVAGVLPSCATNDSLMFIQGVALRKSGACGVKAEFDGTLLQKGAIDRLLAKEYVAALIVGNQLTQRGSRDRLRTETSRVALKGAEVTLESPQGKPLVPPFSSVGTGFVDAADGNEPAPAVMFATLIPASIAPNLPLGTLVAQVRVFGTTLGGEDVESSELSFPIEVCEGCLISYPTSAADVPDGGVYKCKRIADSTAAAASEDFDLPCQPGIDIPIPCTYCSNTVPECDGPSANPYFN